MVTRDVFGAEFVGADRFLDTPTVGLPPRFVADAVRDCIDSWESGSLDLASFEAAARAGRSAYAALIGVDEHRVAMGSSVSSVVGLLAAAIRDNSRVATLNGEFTSVTFPFAAQARRGVTVTELPPGRLEEAAGGFDVVAASLVQSADGAVLDVDTLRASIAGTDTVTVIDATQALGWENVDLSWADLTACGSYKWLLAPRGAAWMSVSEKMIDAVVPHAANWFASEDPWSSLYGLPLRLAADARRFDVSPAWFSVVGAGLSLPWIASLDRVAVEAHTVGLANRLRDHLGLLPSASAIVSIPGAGTSAALQRAGIRAAARAGATRVGFHLYNTDDDLDRLLEALASPTT
jgi:selenocysteine lyase/cysteine desulfurase